MHDRRDLRRRSASSGARTTPSARAKRLTPRADPARLPDVSRAGGPRPGDVRGAGRARPRGARARDRAGRARRRGGGKLRYSVLASRAVRAARTFKPGRRLRALPRPGRADRRPLFPRAARRHCARPGRRGTSAPPRRRRRATAYVVGRAAAVIAVSEYLRRELEAKVPAARGKTEVIDSGVDLERFPLLPARPERGGRPGLPVRGRPDGAQERRPARERLRAAWTTGR